MVVAQETYPHLFEICPLIMRTQGILLVKDAVLIMPFCSADSGLSQCSVNLIDLPCFVTEVKPEQWKQICVELVTCLNKYSDTLLHQVQTFLQIGDTQGAEIIQSSCVGCLAHLAALCDLVGRLDHNSKHQMDIVCDSSLERLGRLTQEMSFEGYTYFDLLLRVRHQVDRSPMVDELTMSLPRFRGRGRWLPLIRGSATYRMRVNPYDMVGKSLQRHGRILRPDSRAQLHHHSPQTRSLLMAENRDPGIQTSC